MISFKQCFEKKVYNVETNLTSQYHVSDIDDVNVNVSIWMSQILNIQKENGLFDGLQNMDIIPYYGSKNSGEEICFIDSITKHTILKNISLTWRWEKQVPIP